MTKLKAAETVQRSSSNKPLLQPSSKQQASTTGDFLHLHAGKAKRGAKQASSIPTEPPSANEAAKNQPSPQHPVKKHKIADELDDIFSKKLAKPTPAEAVPMTSLPAKPSAASNKLAGNKDDIFGALAGCGRARTTEGYAVYSEKELGLDRKNAGDTELCPFDCDCCF